MVCTVIFNKNNVNLKLKFAFYLSYYIKKLSCYFLNFLHAVFIYKRKMFKNIVKTL